MSVDQRTAPSSGAQSRATLALILGVIGLIPCCVIIAPAAWVIGHQELKAIDAGRLPEEDRSFALAGMILGIIGTVQLALGLIWVFVFGGLAALQAMLAGL